MTTPDSRRNFLRGRFSPRAGPLRPPWALAEADFLNRCTRCGDCVRACPTKIIVDHDAGYPGIDFSVGECTFCGDCRTACQTGALQSSDGQVPWAARALINEGCLAHQRVECRVCGEQCAVAAIRFPPRAGGIALPVLDPARCTGCGACVSPCPVQAIAVA
jgi:ferredoxin-type protein NapF